MSISQLCHSAHHLNLLQQPNFEMRQSSKMNNTVRKMLLYFSTTLYFNITMYFCVFPVFDSFKTKNDDKKYFNQILKESAWPYPFVSSKHIYCCYPVYKDCKNTSKAKRLSPGSNSSTVNLHSTVYLLMVS